jgi:hypothetical protein
MQALPAAPAPGAPVALQLFVGEALRGERVAWTTQHAAAFRLHGAQGARDLLPLVPTSGLRPELQLRLPGAGTHVLAYESHPSEVTLEPAAFHAYLAQEGLQAIVRQREAAGTAIQPGRERFRRSAKLLLRTGAAAADGAALQPTGQRMDLVPLDDPLAAAAGSTLRFEARFEGRPLAGVLVKAFHRRAGELEVVQQAADSAGRVALALPHAGYWLLNAVHMVPLPPGGTADWDSFWGSLAFELPARSP